jgi:5'-nucleotidase (lipoprotein e(P4) family)
MNSMLRGLAAAAAAIVLGGCAMAPAATVSNAAPASAPDTAHTSSPPTATAVPPSASSARGGGTDTGREQLHAVLWMQASAEYRAIAAQTWRLATERLPILAQPGSAAMEQWGMDPLRLASLPTAVIVDLDETVLDNSFYQARQAQARRDYDDESWDAWMREAAATAVPGSREFLAAAAAAGHRVFYVTNRECKAAGADPCPQKTATQRNLAALGLPGAADPESLLLRRERPEWEGSDKGVRRAWLGERYRIVALGGDDLRDFVDRPVYEARRDELSPLFGTRWFLLPNAMYGSWDREVSAGACAPGMPADECARRVLERKYQRLEPVPPPLALDGVGAWSPARDRLRLATWNVEYLVEPSTYAALAGRCVADGGRVPGALRRLPCAIVPRLAREEADFAALRRYAAQLDADVVALQEVDGPGAASRLFPGYDYCFTARPNVQKNGFAIRRGLPHRCEPEYLPLSLEDRFRRGVVVTLFPGGANEMTLMAVHLKSGCPEGPIGDAARSDCVALAAQVPALEAWIDAQARAGRRFAVLGDFNRRFSEERGPARDAEGRLQNLWPELDDREPPRADLLRVGEKLKFSKCVSNDPYTSFIDEIVLGRDLAARVRPGGYVRVTYADADARERRLSDHCPVGVDLSLR